MVIADIRWGDDSAENDPNLLSYYVPTPALQRLSSLQKTYIIGRKGSGKTGLRVKLREDLKLHEKTVVEYSPSYHLIQSIVADKDVSVSFGTEIFFQYVWLRTLFKKALIAIGQQPSGTFVSDSLEYARELARSEGQANPDLLESVTSLLTRLKVKAGKIGDLGLQIESTLKSDSNTDVYEYHLNQLLSIFPRLVFIIDDLDLGWDNSRTANNLLLGLLSASLSIRARLHNAHVFLCMREDVYQILLRMTTHSDKYRDTESVRWDDTSLEKLLNERIKFNQERNGTPSSISPFYDVFPERVGRSNTLRWLIERTLGRPRELLQFCRIYTESNNTPTPNSELLKAAEKSYSSWKLDDLCTEFVYQYPGLKLLFDFWRAKYFRLKYHLSGSELEEKLFGILDGCPIQESWFLRLRENADTKELARILYEIGFLGDFIQGGEGGSKIVYSYEELHTPSFKDVQIHPCFRKAVGTVARIRRTADGSNENEIDDEDVED